MSKSIVRWVLTGTLLFSASSSMALGFGLEAGFRQQSGDVTGSNSVSSQNGMQLGVSGVFQGQTFGLRSGMFYVERPLNYIESTLGTEVKTKHTYFDIPIQVMFMLEEYAGIYAGPSISVLLNQKVETSSALVTYNGTKNSTVMPFTVGAHFKFAPQYGLNLFFETINGEVSTSYKNYRAVGANFIFAMD